MSWLYFSPVLRYWVQYSLAPTFFLPPITIPIKSFGSPKPTDAIKNFSRVLSNLVHVMHIAHSNSHPSQLKRLEKIHTIGSSLKKFSFETIVGVGMKEL